MRKMLRTMTEDEFDAQFTVVEGDNGVYHTKVPDGVPVERVWTAVDAEGDIYLMSGYHLVNRIDYVITEEPWTEEIEVAWFVSEENEQDEEDEEDEGAAYLESEAGSATISNEQADHLRQHADDLPTAQVKAEPRPCDVEFDEHEHDDRRCAEMLARMNPEPYDPALDYPEYDPQADHFERFGRPAFPNEY